MTRPLQVATMLTALCLPCAALAQAPAPTVTAVSPSQAYNYQATTVTISGTDFQPGATVSLNAVPLTDVVFVSTTTLTASVPAGLLAGPYTLAVTVPVSLVGTLANGFTVLPGRGGALGPWQSTNFPSSAPTSVTSAKGYLYSVDTGYHVSRALINVDGSLGPWVTFTTAPSIQTPGGTRAPTIFSDGSHLWVLQPAIPALGTLWGEPGSLAYTLLEADGSVTGWQSVPNGVIHGNVTRSIAVGSADVYLIVDWSECGGVYCAHARNLVRGHIESDGAIRVWETVSLRLTLTEGPAIAANCLYTLNLNNLYSISVNAAAIAPDGSVGTWQLAAIRAGFYPIEPQIAVLNGYLYVVAPGGVQKALIQSDCSLPVWSQTLAPTSTGVVTPTPSFMYVVSGDASQFAAFSPFAVTAITPSQGSVAGGTSIIINGADFLPGVAVTIGGAPATATSVLGFTQLAGTTSPRAAGGADVVVTNIDGRTSTLFGGYAYTDTPACTYGVSTTTATSGQAASTGRVTVTPSGSPCPWAAVSTAEWLTITAGGGGTGSGTVTYAVAENSGGTRSGLLVVAGISVMVTQGPTIRVDRGALAFGATTAGAALAATTASQAVTVTFAGTASAWTATPMQPWLQITGGAGNSAGSFTVAVVAAGGLPPSGIVTGAIQVASAGAVNAPLTIPVTLTLAESGTSASPFGAFDTPVAGATVRGSIAVTGWALDDVGIDRVEIWRDPVPGETTPVYGGGGPGNGKIFIATGTFVSGARPDVQAAFPTVPMAYRAGWGYLLLTQGLWAQGNGPVTLFAFAFDAEGYSATLGAKTVTADNAHATKPFGALDTPGYGLTVSGGVWNYGWALTPFAPPCTVTTVRMGIDSGPPMPVSYGALRTDIAAGFPGLANSGGAGGAYYLDTTTLTNGMHQIGWLVTDSCGRQDGIGSRFFTVLNGGG